MHCTSARGVGYTVDFALGAPPTIRDDGGNDVKGPLYGELFRPLFYSHAQILAMKKNPALQLELLDSFEGLGAPRIHAAIAETNEAIRASDLAMRKLARELAAYETRHAELPGIEEQLKGLALPEGAEENEVRAAHRDRSLRSDERAFLAALSQNAAHLTTELTAFSASAERRLSARPESALLEGKNGATVRAATEGAAIAANARRNGCDDLLT